MTQATGIIGALATLIDSIIDDAPARDHAKRGLLHKKAQRPIAALIMAVEGASPRPNAWTTRARPTFLYVIYALLLASGPLALVAAFDAARAQAMVAVIHQYLGGLPQELYTLFGAGYLGYTAARQWGKVRGVEK